MRLNEISDRKGAHRPKKRVGRGMGSGKGKTSGSGHKGQKSRSGVSLLGFEGGQMPLYRRLPKRGFVNPFSKDFAELTTGNLEKAVTSGKIDAKKPVNEDALRTGGVVKKSKDGIRLLAKGELKTKLDLEITGATKGAIAAVEKVGGSVSLLPQKDKPKGKGKARHRKFKEGGDKDSEKKAQKSAEEESKEAMPTENKEKTKGGESDGPSQGEDQA